MKHAIREMIFKSAECRTRKLQRHTPATPLGTNLGTTLRQAALTHARTH